MNNCPVCESEGNGSQSLCDHCGYSFDTREIQDRSRLRAFLAKLKQAKTWQREVIFKKRVNDTQLQKHGPSSTNPELGGWSIRKTASLLDEAHGLTSADIRLAKALAKYPEISRCENKSKAKSQFHKIEKGEIIAGRDRLFESENEFQEFVFNNWEQIKFFRDWKLEKPMTQGKFNTGVIGEIDLLAKHVSEPRWLVVELKKDQSSDVTVGQILRYMGWVKENLARNGDTVEGLIISASAGERIRYALSATNNIHLRLYEFKDARLVLKEPVLADEIPRNWEQWPKDKCEELISKLEALIRP